MEHVFVPKSVREIRDDAFRDCANLRGVIFEEGSMLRTIGKSAFQNCSRLRNISLPEGLEYIGKYCFYNSGLESITFPSLLKTIEKDAFYKC